jgi:predicted Zn-ribbon and HTH transcriptional regulator
MMKRMEVLIPQLKCKRCGHVWKPRVTRVVQCPACKSARWNEAKPDSTPPVKEG